MSTLVARVRRLVPHRLRAFIPSGVRRAPRRWVHAIRVGRAALREGALRVRIDAAASDERWLDEAEAWEKLLTMPGRADPKGWARLAKVYRRAGLYEEALDAAERGLLRFPADVGLAMEHARLAMFSEDWNAAVARWDAVIALAEARGRHGYLWRLEAAVGSVRGATGVHPRPAPARAYRQLATAHRHLGDLDAEDEILRCGLLRHPGDLGILEALADSSTQRRDWPAARERWQAVIEARTDRPASRPFVELALAHQMLGDLGAAEVVLDRAVEKLGRRRSLLVGQAKLAMAERDWPTAVRRWREVLEMRQSPGAFRGLARAQAGQQHFEEAAETLRSARTSRPDHPALAVEELFLLIAQGRWEDVRAAWESLLDEEVELAPAHYAALARRAAVNFAHDMADEFIVRALQQYPEDPGVARQYVRNAVTREKRGRPPSEWRWDDALKRAQELVVEPRDDRDSLLLAFAHELSEAGALTEAREILRGPRRANAMPTEIVDEYATLAMASGAYEEAIDWLTRARKDGESRDVRTGLRLARANVVVGDHEQAREALATVQAQLTPSQWALEVAMIESLVGQVDEAIRILESALQRSRDGVPVAVHRQLALTYLRVGEEHAVRRVVASARQRLGSGLESNPGVVAIIGGGPSLAGMDLTPLRGVAHCVAVNATAMALPWCDVAVTHDPNHLAERFYGFAQPVVAGVSPDFLSVRGRLQGFDLRRRIVTDRLSELDDVLHSGGHTSAHTALGYAYLLRPRRIALFGIDLTDFWGPNDYWHTEADRFNRRGFEERQRRAGYELWEQYRRQKLREAPNVFASTVPQLESFGIQVLNASPRSQIDCFQRVEPQEGIEWCLEGAVVD